MKVKHLYFSRLIAMAILFAVMMFSNHTVLADTSPLCFTARNGSVTVRFEIKNINYTIQYSTNGSTWSNYTSNTNVMLNINQSVYFRAASDQGIATAFGDYVDIYYCSKFHFTSSNGGFVEGSGNIMSLYGPNCPDLPLEPYAFEYLFAYCSLLTTAPSLTATTLASSCYEKMFYGCTSLTIVPKLPASTLTDACYKSMFYGCTSLVVNTSGPGRQWKISASSQNSSSLSYMFNGTSGTMNSTPSVNTVYYVASDNKCNVIVNNNPTMGSISGAGIYTIGDIVTLTAIPYEHYRFVNWNNGSTSSIINFTITDDTTITANFAYEQYYIAALSNDNIKGTVTGGGICDYNSSTKLTAVPNNHYHFVRWSDGNTSNPRTVFVNSDSSFTAIFEIDRYTVACTSERVTGTGVYDYGSTVTLTAHSEEHIHFTQWENGNTDSVYQFVLTCDTVIDAIYDFDILLIMATGDNGYVNGCGEYKYLDYVTLTAVPNEHYKFVGWSDGTYINPYTFQVVDNLTFEAYFENNVGVDDVEYDPHMYYVVGSTIYNPLGEMLRVYSTQGKLVKTGDCDICLESLPPGLYMIVDEKGNNQKMVVAK